MVYYDFPTFKREKNYVGFIHPKKFLKNIKKY